jgi:uroporphyrinogen decarboxylase
MKCLLDVLSQKKKTTRIPIWFMRQAGRYLPEYRDLRSQHEHFMDFIRSPKDVVQVTMQPLKRFDLDAAIIFSDILIIPFALGQNVTFAQGEGPKLDPIRDTSHVQKLRLDHLQTRIAPTLEAIATVKAQMSKDITLIGFAGAPWTVLTYMIEGESCKDFRHTLQMYYTKPKQFRELLQLVEQATLIYLREQIKAGAEVIQLFDSWAGSVPHGSFDELVVAPQQRIIHGLKRDHPDIPIICFPRGIGEKLSHFSNQCRPDGISLDSMRNLIQLDGLVMQGGIDPAVVLAGGHVMCQQVEAVLSYFKDYPYIVNLGHGIPQQTPISHIEEFITYIRSSQG